MLPLKHKQRRNRHGFTLVELVVALFCYTVVLLAVTTLLRFVAQQSRQIAQLQTAEWPNAVVQLQRYLSRERVVAHSAQTLQTVSIDTQQQFLYELYGTQLRRRSVRGGHEPLLLDVASLSLSVQQQLVHCVIITKGGERHEMVWQTHPPQAP